MKTKFGLTLLSLLLSVMMQAQTPSATMVMNEAYAKAKKEKKNVFLMFHASWCGWCHRMDTSMNDASCKKFFDDNYVITHLTVDESPDKKDLENEGADEMRNKYGGKDQGIPYWLVFDAEGKLLADSRMKQVGTQTLSGDNTGCPAAENEVLYFLSVLRKTSNMTREQLEVVKTRFRKNAM
ncbi:MAG TPA: thioredoxin family protein [Chitinophagaceae bacterium]|nr:thioredoxin family protein [Chitinophagaceae bacterium]HMX77805.1 thioredoxin family protein [Chitinophagaceae bacterium]HNF45653.1 thioredoxin family protein [Chitinophagaceae bacterium]